MSDKAHEYRMLLDWFANGEVGSSSKAIVFAHSGITNARWDHPLDPDDFSRCRKLLLRCPFININVMRDKTPTWTDLCDNWDVLTRLFDTQKHAELYSEIKMIRNRQDYNSRMKI